MTNNDTPNTLKRFLYAVDSVNFTQAELEQAVRMAAEMQAELQALLVEDAQLFELAKLPFTREVTPYSRDFRILDEQSLRRSLQRHGEELKRRVEEFAQAARVTWSVKTARGTHSQVCLEIGKGADVIWFGTRHWLHVAGFNLTGFNVAGPGVAARPARAPAAYVYVWYDGSDSARRALRVAASLAAQRHDGLRVIATEEAPAPEFDATLPLSVEIIRVSAALRVGAPQSPISFRGADIVVLPATQLPMHSSDELQQTLERIEAPVVAVR